MATGAWLVRRSKMVEVQAMVLEDDQEETGAASELPQFFVEMEETLDVPQFFIESEGALDVPQFTIVPEAPEPQSK